MERTFFVAEVRAQAGDGDMPTIVGYAAVFDALSVDFGGWRERVAPGAFAESIGKDDIRALWNHDDNYILGRTLNGSLRLDEDETGLRATISPPAVQYARDFTALIEGGFITGMSFGFTTLEDDVTMEDDGQLIRVLRKVKLWEVSPVAFPAYPATSVMTRSDEQVRLLGHKPDLEALRRRALAQQGAEGPSLQVRRAAQRAREIERIRLVF